MAPRKSVKSVAQGSILTDGLIKELKVLVKDLPVSVLGRMDLTAARCCRNGTYAIVKFDMSYPAPRVKKARARK